MMRFSSVLAVVVFSIGSPACGDDGGGGGSGTGGTSGQSTAPDGGDGADGSDTGTDDGGGDTDGFDEQAVLDEAAGFRENFVQINVEARAAQHAEVDAANMWVQQEIVDTYRMLDPDDETTMITFSPGAMIVKEHLDGAGEFIGTAIMYKAPAGFNPDANDWWWADVDAEGTPNDTGTLGLCIACHGARSDNDYVWGVPLDNRQ